MPEGGGTSGIQEVGALGGAEEARPRLRDAHEAGSNVCDAELDPLCPFCGYILRGIESPRCPECGHDIDYDKLPEP